MSEASDRLGTGATGSAPRGITVGELVDDSALGVELRVGAGHQALDRVVRGARVQKSGLALVGHFHGIDPARIQILGATEMSYLRGLGPEECALAIRRFLARDLCCVIVTQCDLAQEPPATALDRLLGQAELCDTPVLLSAERSSRTIVALHALLDERLAPRIRVHGVLLDVFEVGLLLLGPHGVGKSEAALELVMRGHRLVADDVVDCHYRPPGAVFGTPADLLRHHLDVRGLGILNIKELFGVTAVRDQKRIDVIVELGVEPATAEVDPLGLDRRSVAILGVQVPELVIPVGPGRDMASILEIAARNELLKRGGRQPEMEFFRGFDQTLVAPLTTRREIVTPAVETPPPEAERTIPGLLAGEEPTGTPGQPPPESMVGVPPWRRP